jgi:hypothetical protein
MVTEFRGDKVFTGTYGRTEVLIFYEWGREPLTI